MEINLRLEEAEDRLIQIAERLTGKNYHWGEFVNLEKLFAIIEDLSYIIEDYKDGEENGIN